MYSSVVRILAVCMIGCGAACGGSPATMEESAESAPERCTVGGVYSCVRWDCNGFRRCKEDGNGYLPCMCYGEDAGEMGAMDAGNPVLTKPQDSGVKQNASQKPMSMSTPRDAGTAQMQTPPPGKPSTPPANDDGSKQADPPAMPKPDAGMPMTMTTPPPAAMERCDNDSDDDADGKVDCADEDCQANRCVATAPANWQGPVAFQLATAAVSCAGRFDKPAFEAGDQPESQPATCTACSCKGGCSPFLDFATSDGPQCGGNSCSTSVSASCTEISPDCLKAATTASLETAVPGASGCVPSEQKASLAPADWKTRVTACGASTANRGGCTGEAVCLPANAGPGFAAPYCVWREGEHTCEGSVFTRRRVYYRNLLDTRACSPCGCATAGCTYSWRVYNPEDATCASPLLQLSAAEQCAQINPQQGKLRVGVEIKGTGACAATGGESIGSVVADQPITLCCDG